MDHTLVADRAREVSDAQAIDNIHGEPSESQLTEQRDQIVSHVNDLSVHELWNWVDDIDLILKAMPDSARDAYSQAHRDLVVAAMEAQNHV